VYFVRPKDLGEVVCKVLTILSQSNEEIHYLSRISREFASKFEWKTVAERELNAIMSVVSNYYD